MKAKTKEISYEYNGSPDKQIPDAEKVNILLVDDLPDKILSYEVILEELDQNVIVAHSGAEALKSVLEHEFAVILLDVNMPGMDGFETASLIRSRKKSAHTPIIFLTAFPDEIRMAKGYASGAVDYLLTPVIPETLKAKVKVFIELSQMRKLAASQAEEKALRKAAEDSANRFAFLVKVSETLANSKSLNDIVIQLLKLSVPYMADISFIWLNNIEKGSTIMNWLSADSRENTKPLISSIEELPWLKKAIDDALETGDRQIVKKTPMLPDLQKNAPGISGTIMVLPLTIYGKRTGVIVLVRKTTDYKPHDISMAYTFASRASIALENIMLMEKIQEADKRKNEFMAILAHELRNPLAPIRNSLQIMKMSNDSNLRQQSEEIIEHQLKHMIHLVNDLMDVSRITQGKIELRKELITLNAAIKHAIETAEPLIKQRGHVLNINLPEKPIWLEADFARISQIFSNILNNAAKYTDNCGTIEIDVKQEDNDLVIIKFSDNGIGISPETLPHIFEMFSQVDSSLERAQGGLGIGLTLAKKLVEMHDGSITAHSKGLKFGSEFIVKLPIAAEQDIHITENTEAAGEDQKPVLRVLVVDDNEDSAKTLKWMIELAGHETRVAHDGKSAIEIARDYKPSVVLLDIGLPGMSGYDVCKIMKADPFLRDILYIAQTGWSQKEHIKRSKEVGFDHHLIKPIDIKQLQELFTNHKFN